MSKSKFKYHYVPLDKNERDDVLCSMAEDIAWRVIEQVGLDYNIWESKLYRIGKKLVNDWFISKDMDMNVFLYQKILDLPEEK